jgi:hypothetical protein
MESSAAGAHRVQPLCSVSGSRRTRTGSLQLGGPKLNDSGSASLLAALGSAALGARWNRFAEAEEDVREHDRLRVEVVGDPVAAEEVKELQNRREHLALPREPLRRQLHRHACPGMRGYGAHTDAAMARICDCDRGQRQHPRTNPHAKPPPKKTQGKDTARGGRVGGRTKGDVVGALLEDGGAE